MADGLPRFSDGLSLSSSCLVWVRGKQHGEVGLAEASGDADYAAEE
jgi:hypothetical protein